jgi:hypothetical protein
MSFSPTDCSFIVVSVEIAPEIFKVALNDGRIIPIPRTKYPKLAKATDEQLSKWHIDRLRVGIHWEELDKDLMIYPLIEEAEKLGQIRYLDAS